MKNIAVWLLIVASSVASFAQSTQNGEQPLDPDRLVIPLLGTPVADVVARLDLGANPKCSEGYNRVANLGEKNPNITVYRQPLPKNHLGLKDIVTYCEHHPDIDSFLLIEKLDSRSVTITVKNGIVTKVGAEDMTLCGLDPNPTFDEYVTRAEAKFGKGKGSIGEKENSLGAKFIYRQAEWSLPNGATLSIWEDLHFESGSGYIRPVMLSMHQQEQKPTPKEVVVPKSEM